MVSAPIVVLLFDRTFFAGNFRSALARRKVFYAALAATWIVLALCVASTGGNRGGSAGFDVGVSWWDYELTQFRAIVHYLRLSLWPAPLVFEYGSFWINHAADVAVEMIFVLGLAVASLLAVWRRPALGFLGCWFFASLAVTSVVPGTTQMIVEHRMYLPLAAVIGALVLGAAAWLGPRSVWLWLLPALVCVALTIRRNEDYRSELAIWGDTVAKRPGNALAHEMLGQALDRAGRYDEAAEHHDASLKIFPAFAVAHVSLGDDLVRAGKIPEAIGHYEAALRTKSDYVDAHHELGIALARAGHRAEAIAHFETTLQLKPDFADAHFDLANVLSALDRNSEATAHYEAALKLRPDYPAAHFNFANLLFDAGKPAEAITHYRAAVAQRPNFPDALFALGMAQLQLGRRDEAIAALESVLQLNPHFPDARETLARVRAGK
jgi:tetratricopeptide (TPR) repeat protein